MSDDSQSTNWEDTRDSLGWPSPYSGLLMQTECPTNSQFEAKQMRQQAADDFEFIRKRMQDLEGQRIAAASDVVDQTPKQAEGPKRRSAGENPTSLVA